MLGPIFDAVKSNLRMWKLCVCTSTSTVCVGSPVEENEVTILQLFPHVQDARVYARTHIRPENGRVKK